MTHPVTPAGRGALTTLSDWHIEVLYRIAKSRARPFFADPRTMKDLREERDRRRQARQQPGALVLTKQMRVG